MSHAEERWLATAKYFTLAVFGAATLTALMTQAAPAHADTVSAGPSVSLTKRLVGGTESLSKADAASYTAGTKLTWEYVITNTGDEPVWNPSVTDDQGVPVTGCPVRLEVGESGVCTGTGIIGDGLYGLPFAAPTLAGEALPDGTNGSFYSYALERTGSPAPIFTVASGALPEGLTLTTAGVITGTPTTAGTSTFTVAATNTAGTASKAFSITTKDLPPTITTNSLSNAISGQAYSATIEGTGKSVTWTVSTGALPAGLSLDAATGTISGTPTTDGTSTFSLSASNTGGTVTKNFTLVVDIANPIIAGTTMADAKWGVNYSQQIPGVGQNLTYTVTSGSLPSGLTMNSSGLITGSSSVPWTSTNGDKRTFTVQVSNSTGSASASFTLLAYPAPPPALAYSGTITRTISAPSFSAGTEYCPLPDLNLSLSGLTVSGGNGATLKPPRYALSCSVVITRVTQPGTYAFTIARTNITGSASFILSAVFTTG